MEKPSTATESATAVKGPRACTSCQSTSEATRAADADDASADRVVGDGHLGEDELAATRSTSAPPIRISSGRIAT